MDPRIWGADVWRALHHIALGFPAAPSEADKQAYREFFTALGPVLPCQACSDNYARHLRELPLEPYLRANPAPADVPYGPLFEWSVQMHNMVNKETGKPTRSAAEAYAALAAAGKTSRSLLSPAQATTLGLGALVGIAMALVAVYLFAGRRAGGKK